MSIWARKDAQRDIQPIKLFLLYQGRHERCKLALFQTAIDQIAVNTRRSSPVLNRRSLPLNNLPPLAIQGVSVYNLQHEKFLERVTKTYLYPGTDG